MKLNPLNSKIGELVNQFLDDKEYFERLKTEVRLLGQESEDPNVIKTNCFSFEGEELTFASKVIEELFYEWQLFEKLIDSEPYGPLIEAHPEKKLAIMAIANKVWNGEDVKDEEILDLFDV